MNASGIPNLKPLRVDVRDLRRARATERLRQLLKRRAFPRIEMTLMLAVAGLAGFLASALLLHLGLTSMSTRYPMAVLVAYATLLLLVRGWVARHLHGRRSHLEPLDVVDIPTCGSPPAEPSQPEFGGGSFGGGGAGGVRSCVFRTKPDTDSGGIRTRIPIQSGQ